MSAYEDTGTLVNLPVALGPNPRLRDIDVDAEVRYLWVARDNQLRRHDIDTGALQLTKNIDNLKKIGSDSQGGLWFAANRVLGKLDAMGRVILRRTPFALAEGNIVALAADPADLSVWAATKTKLKHIDVAGTTLLTRAFSLPRIRDLVLYRDTISPELSFTSPAEGAVLNTATPTIGLSYSDIGTGVDTSTLVIKANDAVLNVGCTFETENAMCTPSVPLPEGPITLTGTLKDFAGNLSRTARVSFTIDINQPPVAVDDAVTTTAGNPVTIAVLANDSDPDGDTLAVSSFTQGAHGTVTFAGDVATYTPEAGFTGMDTFTYTLSDGHGGTDTATVKVTVTGNEPPVLNPIGNRTVILGTSLSLQLTATDPNGDPLTFSAAPLPLPPNASLHAKTGVFTFIPGAEQVGNITLTFMVSDGSLMDSETITITVQGVPPDGVTALSGRLLDTNAFVQGQEVPVVGAVVSLLGTGFAATSDSTGRFTLSGVPAGSQVLDIATANANPAPDGSPYAGFREEIDLIEKVNNVVSRPFFLPRIAMESVTPVDPDNTTEVCNPTLNVCMTVPPHTAKNEEGNDFTGGLSISEVPEALAPAALPKNLEPGLLITIQPVGVTFAEPVKITFPNIDKLTPGSETDLWSLDPETGTFRVVGKGQVSANGSLIETVSGGILAADWHMAMPPFPGGGTDNSEHNQGNQGNGTSCPVCGGVSTTSPQTGGLTRDPTLPSYRSLGVSRGIELIYNSLAADPRPVLPFDSIILSQAAVPPSLSYQLEIAGVQQGTEVFVDTSGLDGINDETIRNGVQFDASTLPTGRYPVTVRMTSNYEFSGVSSTMRVKMLVNNERASPFGIGWTLKGLQRLHIQADQSIVLTEGDGAVKVFGESVGEGQWLARAPLPTPRGALVAETLSDGIHVIGGNINWGGSQQFVAHEVYDPASDTWTVKAEAPDLNMWDPASAVVGGKLYLLGGWSAGDTFTREYDPAADSWQYRAPIPEFGFSWGHTAAVVNNQIYVMGGSNGPKLLRYDPGTDSWTSGLAPIPQNRTGLAAAAIGGNIYVVGTGFELQIYDTATDAWTQGASLTMPTTAPSIAVLDGKLYVFGGSTNDPLTGGDLNTVQIYDPATDTWELGAAMPASRSWSAATVHAGKAYVFGGFDLTNQALDSNEQFFVPPTDQDIIQGPPGDFSTLVKNPNGTFTRTLKDGTKINFSATGLHTSTVDRNGNTTTYAYDTEGRLGSITDSRGRVTTFTYAGGLLSSVTDPVGRVTSFTHDGAGNLTKITYPDGSTELFKYSGRHLLIEQTNQREFMTKHEYNFAGRFMRTLEPDDSTRALSSSQLVGLVDTSGGLGSETNPAPVLRPEEALAHYTDGNLNPTALKTDSLGNITRQTDALNRTTTIVRDPDGNPTQITRPNGAITTMTYDERGNLLTSKEESIDATTTFTYEPAFNQVASITDPQGNKTTINYDAKGNPIEIIDAEGTKTVLSYADANCPGQLTSVTSAAGLSEENTTTFEYDPATCNLVQTTDPLGNTTTLAYDAAGNVIQSADAEGRVTRFRYDVMNRLTKVIDATNLAPDPDCGTAGVTCYGYDKKGNLTTVTDARGNTTVFDYDEMDRLKTTIDPVGNPETFAYDDNGNLLSTLDRKGQTISFEYDVVNQLIKKTLPGNLVTTFAYDAVGNLKVITDPDSKLTLGYDLVNRLISASTAGSPSQPGILLSHTYDKNGNRKTLTDPAGQTSYVYDELNRLRSLTNPAGQIISFDYDALSRRTKNTLPNGTTASFAYDPASQLLNLANTEGATNLSKYTYAYDKTGNRNQVDQERSAAAVFPALAYQYDALNRLTRAAQPPLPGITVESYNYDPVGNRLRRDGQSVDAIFDAANRLLEDQNFTYDYDPNGNLTQKTEKVDGATTTYTYDAENRLTRIDFPGGRFAEYRYDGLGRRIEKNDNGQITRYVYDNEDILFEFDGANTLLARYTHGPDIDEPLVMERDVNGNGGFEATERFSYHADGLGSVTELTDSTGAAARAYVYDSFGQITQQAGTLQNPYTYTGREFDAESGLYYYRARYYDARVGRFLQEDPVSRNIRQPAALNLYPYVNNNPLNFVDPSGSQVGAIIIDELLRRLIRRLIEEFAVLPAVAGAVAGVAIRCAEFNCPTDLNEAQSYCGNALNIILPPSQRTALWELAYACGQLCVELCEAEVACSPPVPVPVAARQPSASG